MLTDSAKGPSPALDPAQTRRGSRSLNQRLDAIAADIRARDPDGAEAVDRFVVRLKAACVGKNAPEIGDAFPHFLMPDDEGRLVSRDGLLVHGPLVVVFNRGHWCPYCRTAIAALAEQQARIAPAQIVAISAETQRFTRRIRAETGARFPFLTDIDGAYAEAIGLAVTIEPPLRDLLAKSGKRIPDFQGGLRWVLPVPAVFLLDHDGIVRAKHVDPDYRRRMEVDVLLQAIEGLAG